MTRCTLTHFESREVITANSVTEFCKKAGFKDKNAQVHMYPVIRGERLHHKGWALPQFAHAFVHLKDIYGNEYAGTIRELVTTYQVPACRLWNLLLGKKKICSGLSLVDTDITKFQIQPFKIKRCVIKTPNNKLMYGKSINAIANQLKGTVSYKSCRQIVIGLSEKTKGFSVEKIEVEQKKILKEKH